MPLNTIQPAHTITQHTQLNRSDLGASLSIQRSASACLGPGESRPLLSSISRPIYGIMLPGVGIKFVNSRVVEAAHEGWSSSGSRVASRQGIGPWDPTRVEAHGPSLWDECCRGSAPEYVHQIRKRENPQRLRLQGAYTAHIVTLCIEDLLTSPRVRCAKPRQDSCLG